MVSLRLHDVIAVAHYVITVTFIATHIKADCELPDFTQYSFQPFRPQSSNTFRAKKRLFMKCQDAYVKRSGEHWIKCQRDGAWDGLGDLNCELRTCKIPDHIDFPHGTSEAEEYTVGNFMVLSCDNGYTLRGSPRRRCMSDGNWNDELPTCEAMPCPEPPVDENMYVSLRVIDRWDFHHGDSVHVTCPSGYVVVDTKDNTDYIRCEEGSWTKEFECQEITCAQPVVQDGYVVDEDNDGKWPVHSEVQVRCNDGASLAGQPGTITCLKDGFWDSVPECYSVCTSDNVKNGYINKKWQSDYPRATLYHGGTGYYHCDEGYEKGTSSNKVKCKMAVLWAESSSYWRDFEDTPLKKKKVPTATLR